MTWTTQPRSDATSLAAISVGSGTPLVLLHGVGLQAEAWGAQLDVLAQRGHVIAPDMAGHGHSPPPLGHMDLTDYADAVLNLLKSLDQPAVVIGHSMGAMIALHLAATAPAYMAGVVALNAVFERSPAAATAVQKRASDLSDRHASDPIVTLERWFGQTPSPERDACQNWLTTIDPRSYKMAYTAFATSHIPDRTSLAQITCPTMFMTGAKEPNSTPLMSETMAGLVKNAQVKIIDHAAHMMPMTHALAVNTNLLSFLRKVHPLMRGSPTTTP